MYLTEAVGVVAGMLVASYIVRITLEAVRWLRRGQSTGTVAAHFTCSVSGLVVTVAAALVGGALAAKVLGTSVLAPALAYGIQVVAGLLASYFASLVYARWLSKSLLVWFLGGEDLEHGR